MDSAKHCAYNQTRECFLGLEVSVVDLPHSELKELLAELALKSGEGLWILPYRGLPAAKENPRVPFDLIYLNVDGRVVDIAESVIACPASPSPRVASVLLLPTHTIYSSQTLPGDQLLISEAREMQRRIEEFCTAGDLAGAVQNEALIEEASSGNGNPGVDRLLSGKRFEERRPEAHQLQKTELVEPEKTPIRSQKSWLERWWSADARKAHREPVTSLAAYYWTGATPVAQSIRDISSTGLYLVTKESLYPDTLVLMTIQKTDCGKDSPDSIYVNSRAVRRGPDGVGFQFVLPDAKGQRTVEESMFGGADRKLLDRFLKRLRKDKG